MKTIDDKNFYVVTGWMMNHLNLEKMEIPIYAIIYGFSVSKHKKFTGSISYLMKWCNCSKNTIIKSLKSLVDKGYIVREETRLKNNTLTVSYCTNFNAIPQSYKCTCLFSEPVYFEKTTCSETAPKTYIETNYFLFDSKLSHKKDHDHDPLCEKISFPDNPTPINGEYNGVDINPDNIPDNTQPNYDNNLSNQPQQTSLFTSNDNVKPKKDCCSSEDPAPKQKRQKRSYYLEDLDLSIVPDYMKESMVKWLEYKKERGEVLTPTGFKGMVTRYHKNCRGIKELFDAMVDYSMDHNQIGVSTPPPHKLEKFLKEYQEQQDKANGLTKWMKWFIDKVKKNQPDINIPTDRFLSYMEYYNMGVDKKFLADNYRNCAREVKEQTKKQY